VSRKYLVHKLAKNLANEIVENGFRGDVHKRQLANLDDEQRKSTIRAIFDRLFTKKQAQIEIEGYKIKHGRGMEIN